MCINPARFSDQKAASTTACRVNYFVANSYVGEWFMKTPHCKSCGNTNQEDFYKSINTYCREHWKEKVKTNRESKPEQYKAYERSRAHLPHRIQLRKLTNNGLIGLYCVIPKNHKCLGSYTTGVAYTKRQPNDRIKRPNLYKSHKLLAQAKRNKKLIPTLCEVCGSNKRICGHHDDYLKPLSVRWLCTACHNKWHAKNGEGKNP